MVEPRPEPTQIPPYADSEESPPTIALGLENGRTRALLSEYLTGYETIPIEGLISDNTDLCVVDPGGFSRTASALERWKREQFPATAPTLLLADGDETALWNEYGEAIGNRLDAVQSISAPKRAVLTWVRCLLETRRYSIAATHRHERLGIYERAMDGANIGITIADASKPDMPLIYANDGFEAITGYDLEDVIGRSCQFLQGGRTDPETVDHIRERLDDRKPVSVEILNYRKSGEPFWNDLDIMPVTDDSTVTHFLGFQEDITERRRREADLERYEQVLQSLDDPVFVSDARRRVELTNEAAERLLGGPDGISTEARVTALFPSDVRVDVREALSAVERTGEPQERELTLAGKSNRIYQFRFQRERSTTGRPLSRIIVIGRDVTTLREYQNRLSVLDRVLRHNLRNKLAVISGNTDLLTDFDSSVSPETTDEIIENIGEAVEELLGLAESARRFHRSIEPGTREGTEVDVNALVADLLEFAREECPNADVRADVSNSTTAIAPSTIRTGLEGIVENAIIHADSPTPTVRIIVTERPDSNTVEIRIKDTGPGIPKREREALSRGAETSLEHLQGITLWLVNWAVRSVGGTFEIADNEPTGTVVTVRLPRSRTPREPSTSESHD